MKNIQKSIEKYGIWVIVVMAAVIRFTGLTKRDFWYDEAFTGIAVKESWQGMLAMITNDVHPPLYYATLKIFSSFFNYSVVGIRIYSAIFGVLAIWALYLFAKELFNKKAALFAAALATVSPIAIQYSQEARMYSMLVALTVFAAYFLVRALKTNQQKYYILWGIFMGLSALTHYMGIIFSPLYLFAYITWNAWDFEGLKKQASWQSLKNLIKKILPDRKILIGIIVAIVVFSPWLGKFFFHFMHRGNALDWIKPVVLGDIFTNVQMFLFGTPLGEMSAGMPQPSEFIGVGHLTTRIILAVSLVLITIYLFRNKNNNVIPDLSRNPEEILKPQKNSYAVYGARQVQDDNKHTYYRELTVVYIFSFGFLLLIYVLSLLGKQYFVVRYVLAAGYFLFAIIGFWLSTLNWRWVVATATLYAILLFSIVPVGYSRGYNEMIKHLDKYQGNNFYILNSFDYVISKYYLGADNLTLYNYDWPQYNPDYWAAIGKKLKRTESYDDLRNDPNALIISNQQLTRDNQYFSTEGLVLVDQYENILIYKFQ